MYCFCGKLICCLCFWVFLGGCLLVGVGWFDGLLLYGVVNWFVWCWSDVYIGVYLFFFWKLDCGWLYDFCCFEVFKLFDYNLDKLKIDWCLIVLVLCWCCWVCYVVVVVLIVVVIVVGFVFIGWLIVDIIFVMFVYLY